MSAIEISGLVGVILGFITSIYMIRAFVWRRPEAPSLGWRGMGCVGMASAFVFMLLGGFLEVAKSLWCGVAFFAMVVCWTVGGNLALKLPKLMALAEKHRKEDEGSGKG